MKLLPIWSLEFQWKMGQIKKDSCRAVYSSRHFAFLVPVPVGLVSCSSIPDLAASISTIMDPDEGKIWAIFVSEYVSVHQNDSFSN